MRGSGRPGPGLTGNEVGDGTFRDGDWIPRNGHFPTCHWAQIGDIQLARVDGFTGDIVSIGKDVDIEHDITIVGKCSIIF